MRKGTWGEFLGSGRSSSGVSNPPEKGTTLGEGEKKEPRLSPGRKLFIAEHLENPRIKKPA